MLRFDKYGDLSTCLGISGVLGVYMLIDVWNPSIVARISALIRAACKVRPTLPMATSPVHVQGRYLWKDGRRVGQISIFSAPLNMLM